MEEDQEKKSETRMEDEGSEQGQKVAVMDEKMKRKKKVLVAIDESEGSFYALKWSLDYFFPADHDQDDEEEEEKEEEIGTIILLNVQRPFQNYIIPAVPGPAAAAVYVPSSVVDSVRKAQEQNSASLLSRALQLCKNWPVVIAETKIMVGEPKEMICEAVEQIHPDLLIVGSRGLGTIKRTFLGSVSDYCALHAKCPVLIVKPPK